MIDNDCPWTKHRHIIEQKYLNERLTTKAVQKYMKEVYSFHGSIQQYERKFTKWGFRKNRTQAQYENIAQELKRKRLDPDHAEVIIGNDIIPHKRLKKAFSRHCRPTLRSKWCQAAVHLPKSTEACGIDNSSVPAVSATIAVRPALGPKKSIQCATNLPWYDINDLVARAFDTFKIDSGGIHRWHESALRKVNGLNEVCQYDLVSPKVISTLLDSILVTPGTRSLHQDLKSPQLQPSTMSTKKSVSEILVGLDAFVVERRKGDLEESANIIQTNSESNAAAVAMTYILYMLSNDLVDEISRARLSDVFRASEATHFTRTLVSSSLLSAKSAVKQLILCACESLDISLLEQLHACGVNFDQSLESNGSDPLTALQYAFKNKYRKSGFAAFIERLLQLGANPNACWCCTPSDSGIQTDASAVDRWQKCCCCSYLAISSIFSESALELLPCLLEAGVHVCSCFGLISAIEVGAARPELLQPLARWSIFDYDGRISGNYWSCLQAALGCKQFDLAVLLLENGSTADILTPDFFEEFDPATSDFYSLDPESPYFIYSVVCERDARSPLALALMHGQYDIAARLLVCGCDPDACYLDFLDMIDAPLSISDDASDATNTNFAADLGDLRCLRTYLDEPLRSESTICTPLQAAIYSGSVKCVELILDAGASLTSVHGLQPLILAAMGGNIEIVRLLLDRGAEVDSIEQGYCAGYSERNWFLTPLAEASARGFASVMAALIDAGADVNSCPTIRSLTPLQASIACNTSRKAVRLLLAQPGINIWHSRSDNSSLDAFAVAIRFENYPALEDLLSFCSMRASGGCHFPSTQAPKDDADHYFPSLGMYPAQATCDQRSSLVADADTLFYDLIGKTQLQHRNLHIKHMQEIFKLAVVSDKPHLAWSTLEQGTEMTLQTSLEALHQTLQRLSQLWQSESQDKIGTTFCENFEDSINAIIASQGSNWGNSRGMGVMAEIHATFHTIRPSPFSWNDPLREKLVQVLQNLSNTMLTFGVDFDSCSTWSPATPIQLAVQHRHPALVQYLACHNVDLNKFGKIYENQPSMTPLQRSVADNSHDFIDILLQHGADVNYACSPHKESLTALGAACHHCETDIITKLVKAGAHVNMPANFRKESSLTIAARRGRLDIVLEILHLGGNVNGPVSHVDYARSALQAACEEGHLDIVKVLINYKADVNEAAGASRGVTALQAAAMKGYFKICQILVGCGAKVSASASPIDGRTAINGAIEWGRLDITKFLLDNYDGDETIEVVCRSAKIFAREHGRLVIADMLATYGSTCGGTVAVN